MKIGKFTDAELLILRKLYTERSERIRLIKSELKVNGSEDTINVNRQRRLSKVLCHCDCIKTNVNMTIRNRRAAAQKSAMMQGIPYIDPYTNGDKYRDGGKRTKATTAMLMTDGPWKKKYLQLCEFDENLPKILIGNAVLKELPFNNLNASLNHPRLRVFALKGYKCVHPECNKTASRLIETMDANGGRHLDVFTADLQHMNVDHILARSQGGNDDLDNLQPMCAKHNSRKGNKLVPY